MHRYILVVLTLALSACGFHLRGNMDFSLPPGVEPIYISGSTDSAALGKEVRKLLKAYNVQITDTASQANHQLIIVDYKSNRRSASIGRGARAAEIQLIDDVSFELQNKQGQTIMGPNKMTERRILQNDPNKVASTSSEEALIRREMLSNLAAKIARQVSAANYSQKPGEADVNDTSANSQPPRAQATES